MKIHNVRLGFATNSSSTHSIIFLKPRQKAQDDGVESYEFGWDYWTAASETSKRQYVAIQLFQALSHQVNHEVAEAVVDAWVPGYVKSGSEEDSYSYGGVGSPKGYVDHHAGQHAPSSLLTSLAYTLGKLQVFEVALGGGEPTLHPDFVEILTNFRHYGVVPNFTTKNLGWLRDATVWPKVMETIGSFAFSAGSAKDVQDLSSLLIANKMAHHRVNIQYVMGTTHLYEFENIVKAAAEANFRITLLGYKLTGRGDDFQPQDYKDWMKHIKKLHKEKCYFNLGIDTKLASESGEALKKAGIHTSLYETREGMFSCYIDAVGMKMGASSFVDDIAMKRLTHFGEKEILETFRGYK